MTEIIEKELAYRINGCVFDVHNEVGPGLREECYQKAMEIRLAQAGLPFLAKPRTDREVTYLGELAAIFQPDLIVSDRVVIELKTSIEAMPVSAFRQTINYLKCFHCRLGMLVNFADATARIHRIVFDEPKADPEEDFKAVRDLLNPDARTTLIAVREVLLAVHAEFGLGYSEQTYRNLIRIGLIHRGLSCEGDLVAEPVFRERRLPHSIISPLKIENSILLQVDAIQDEITARAVRTMQTHLKCMRAAIGVIVSFGQNRFTIRGVGPLANETRTN